MIEQAKGATILMYTPPHENIILVNSDRLLRTHHVIR